MSAKFIKENGEECIQITLPLIEKDSKSGKAIIIAQTEGFVPTGEKWGGRTVTMNVNVCVRKSEVPSE